MEYVQHLAQWCRSPKGTTHGVCRVSPIESVPLNVCDETSVLFQVQMTTTQDVCIANVKGNKTKRLKIKVITCLIC